MYLRNVHCPSHLAFNIFLHLFQFIHLIHGATMESGRVPDAPDAPDWVLGQESV